MNEPRWYCVDKDGHANVGWSRCAAAAYAALYDSSYPSVAPHRAVQLVDAAELEAAQKRIAELEAELKNLKALLRAVFEELDDGDGNAPGDSHETPGIWDDDNPPDIAGKPCHWCELWAMVKEAGERP